MKLNFGKNLLPVAAISIVVLLGLLHLHFPFFGDQAFFLLGAKEMHEGLVLYRDFWDIKQPGIFYFFLVGGKLFGFNEFGIHFLELLYWILFSIILIWFLLKFIFKDTLWLAAVSSLLVVGSYYICAGTGKLTQVEALVNFPLLMVVIFNYLYLNNTRNRYAWLLLSGIAAGAVILLKLIFLPILGFLYILLVVRSFRNNRSISRNLAEIFIVAAGFIIACMPFFIYCIKNQIGNLVLETFFITPAKVIAQAEHKSIQHLIVSVLGFFPRVAFIVLVFLYGAYHFRKNPFVQDMITWVSAGLFVILIQRTSWWGYHFQLLYAPLGIVAAFGIKKILEMHFFQQLISAFHFNKHFAVGLLVFLIFSPQIFIAAYKLKEISQYDFLVSKTGREAFINADKFNFEAIQVAKQMDGKKGDIFIAGDPLIYYHSKRNQATAKNGWGLQFFIPEQWLVLKKELEKSLPCYIYIDRYYDQILNTKGAIVTKWIERNYSLKSSDEFGRLYTNMY